MQVLFQKEASYFVKGGRGSLPRDQAPDNDSVMEGDANALKNILICRNSALYMALDRSDFVVNTEDYLMLKR